MAAFRLESRRSADQSGLSLIEVLVTVLLTSLAFSLIFALTQAQAKVYRHQQVIDRFIVDAEACLSLLEADLSSTFVAAGTAGSTILELGHLLPNSFPGSGEPPFNSLPLVNPSAAPDDLDPRGRPLKTSYILDGETLIRQSALLLPPATLLSRLPLLVGVNSASGTVAGAMVTVRITLVSNTKTHTVEKLIYAPGLATP